MSALLLWGPDKSQRIMCAVMHRLLGKSAQVGWSAFGDNRVQIHPKLPMDLPAGHVPAHRVGPLNT